MAYFKGPKMEILPNIGFAAEMYNVWSGKVSQCFATGQRLVCCCTETDLSLP